MKNLPPMAPETRESFKKSIITAQGTWAGKKHLADAKSFLITMLVENSFNTEGALEVFKIEIERSLIETIGAQMVLSIRGYGIIEEFAENHVNLFKSETGATDQRKARRGLLALIIGK